MVLKHRNFEPHRQGPLSGLRVLDLSRLVCGNTLTLMLADYGADVIKVEPPAGDTLRSWKTGKVETHWKTLARNKRSLCLDLRKPEALKIVRDLATQSSIFVESFRPGTIEKMGLGPEDLHALNPGLVIVRISGWGQTGPYSGRPGFGSIVEGMSGLAAMTGFPDREPVLPPNALADSVAAFVGSTATMIALRNVEQNGGKGQVVDLPLFDPLFSILGPQAAQFRITGEVRPRTGSRSTNAAPRNVYKTFDEKYVALSASVTAMAHRLFTVIGRPDLITNPKFADNPSRVAHGTELDEIIGEFIGQKTQAENLAFFEAAEITIGPIYDISQIIEDPHIQDREVIVELPDSDMGYFPSSGIVPKLVSTPGGFYRPAPKLGEHNEEVLRSLGLGEADIQDLAARGVVVRTSLETVARRAAS